MNNFEYIITPLTMALSLTTAYGVLLHDTHLDKAFTSATTGVYTTHDDGTTTKVKLGGMPHTHSEGISLSQAVRDRTDSPRTTPRGGDRKHLWQKRVTRNTEFDGHRLDVGQVCLGRTYHL